MIFKIEIECPYCDKIHVHRLDIGVASVNEEYPNLLEDFYALQKEREVLISEINYLKGEKEEKHNGESGSEKE